MPSRHRFLEPIHNVKERRNRLVIRTAEAVRKSGLHTWKILVERIGIEPMTSSLQS